MADETEHNANPESHTGGYSTAEHSAIMDENKLPHVALAEEEIGENAESGPLFREKERTSDLKSVQDYTSRIRSFLGWESIEETLESLKERDGFSVRDKDSSENETAGAKDEIDIYSDVESSPEIVKADEECDADDVDESTKSKHGSEIKISENEIDIHNLNSEGNQTEMSYTNERSVGQECVETNANTGIESSANDTKSNEIELVNEHCDSPPKESHKKIGYEEPMLVDRNEELQLKDEYLELYDEYPVNQSMDSETNKAELLDDSEPCTESIRRLSLGILRDVIDSAGNSIHEFYLNKKSDAGNDNYEKNNENFGISNAYPMDLDSNRESSEANIVCVLPNKLPQENSPNDSVKLNKIISKPCIENIRRLSLDIVKDVIDSARNSVHELQLNKASDEQNHNCKEVNPNFGISSPYPNIDDNQESSEDNPLVSNELTQECYPSYILNKNVSKPYMESIRRLSLDIVKDVIDSARNSVHDLYLNETNEPEKYSEVLKFRSSIAHSNLSSFQTESETDSCGFENNFEAKDLINDTVCGLGCFQPDWIQKLATPKVYLFVFSLIGVVHGSYYNYFVAMISTLEKRYAFRSKVSGTLLMADEITPLVFGVIVGYVGDKTHRPRMVAFGMFLSATCCFVTALPYFIYGSAKHMIQHEVKNTTAIQFCNTDLRNSCDAENQPPTMSVVGLFLFASFLKGFATLSYYIIGIPYMDDNSKKKDSPLYIAIALALRLLGPLVGFLMSSGFLKFYENPFEDPGYGPDDPRWIGAWWMGFVVQGVLLIIFTIPIALFPRRLPGQRKPHQQSSADGKEMWKNLFRGLLDALKRLWLNPIFVFMAINTTMKIFGRFGHAIMLPKYMENQFRLSASDASLFSGATSIFCIMVSTVTGGFLIWKYRPAAKTLLTGMIASEVTLCLGYLILMIPRCQPVDILHFGSNQDGFILNSLCNRNCDCSTTSFTPFCGPDGKSAYFSPCFAGCTLELDSIMTDKQHKEFGNCSCVADENGDLGAKITEGFCVDETCWTQTLAYICILLILVTVSNTLTVAHTIILLRSVHPNDKSVALGTFETFICLFGFIPFPVTFGALVDSACVIWEKSCGETGNCWFYDMKKYNYLLHGASSFFCSVSICCLTTLYCLSSRLKDLYKDEEPDEDQNVKLDTISGPVTKL